MSNVKNQPGEGEAREAVKLARHHTHAGVDRSPGDEIEVTPNQKQWLMQRGIIANDNPTQGE